MSIGRRQANDVRQRILGSGGGLIAFVCECADPACRRTVELTRAEAEELRRQGDPIVVHGHVPVADARPAAEAAALGLPSDTPGAAIVDEIARLLDDRRRSLN
jgi:hypothetical protein